MEEQPAFQIALGTTGMPFSMCMCRCETYCWKCFHACTVRICACTRKLQEPIILWRNWYYLRNTIMQKRTLVPVEKHCTHELIYYFFKVFLCVFCHCIVTPLQRHGPTAVTTARLAQPQIPPGHLTPLKQGPPCRSTAPGSNSHPIPSHPYNRRCPVPRGSCSAAVAVTHSSLLE